MQCPPESGADSQREALRREEGEAAQNFANEKMRLGYCKVFTDKAVIYPQAKQCR